MSKVIHCRLNTNNIIPKNKNEQAIPPAHPHHKGVNVYTTPVSMFQHRSISSLCHQPHLQGLLQFLPSAVIVTQRLVQVHKINVFRQNSK